MDTSLHRLLGSLLIVIGGLSLVGTARAADSVITYQLPTNDPAGIGLLSAPGVLGCGSLCGSLRLAARTAMPARRQGMLAFTAPGGTTIVSATIRVHYRTKHAGVSAHVQNRVGGRWIDAQRLRSTGGKTASITAGRGATAVAVTLTADSAVSSRAVKSEAENAVSVSSAQLTVRDLATPVVGWASGDPASGTWQRGVLCGSFSARDAGLGVDHVDYAIGDVVATVNAGLGTRLQPRPLGLDGSICIDTTQVGDGTFGTSLSAVDTGPSGNRSAAMNGLVRIDNTPPVVIYQPPANPEARFPESQLAVNDASSGVEHLTVAIDGLPASMRTMNGLTTVAPSAPLVDGTHRVTWEAADIAGNAVAGSELFGVSDTTPPTIDSVQPLAMTTPLADVIAHAVDTGAGLTSDGWRLAIDGVDVTGATEIGTAGTIMYVPTRPWSPGDHAVRVTAVDRSGNRAVRSWTFSIPVPAPPAPVAPEPTPPSVPVADTTPATADAPNGGASETTDAQATAAPSLTLRSSARRLRSGRLIQLRGRVRGLTPRRVTIEARVKSIWRVVVTVPIGPDGAFSTRVRVPSPGRYVVRARSGILTSPLVRLLAR